MSNFLCLSTSSILNNNTILNFYSNQQSPKLNIEWLIIKSNTRLFNSYFFVIFERADLWIADVTVLLEKLDHFDLLIDVSADMVGSSVSSFKPIRWI